MRISLRIALACLLIITGRAALCAQGLSDVTAMTLEDLMNVRVTSVSKRAQKLADAPAAVFVITQDDIRRSGARNIPEALRLAPGIEVARIDENKWAITARGFNHRFANKLLVLLDGRSLYTPLFSGVYWTAQDVFLEDVDRIEIIRGPGATMWGANAVNGVINIITKDTSETRGTVVNTSAGNERRGEGGFRFGGKAGDTYYRTYSKYFDWRPSDEATDTRAFDGWHSSRTGFRFDHSPASEDSLTLQGDLYSGRYGDSATIPQLTPPYSITQPSGGSFSGGNLLSRWTHMFSRSTTSLQVYFDRANNANDNLVVDHQNTYDLDFQHDFHITETHEFIWGAGYRAIQDGIDSSDTLALVPTRRTRNLFNGFAQDEFTVLNQRLHITLGSKLEHNDYTGVEIEPNARLVWVISPRHSFWTAISRAVRTPARTEEDIRLVTAVSPPSNESQGLPIEAQVVGNPQIQSEDLIAYETGYRARITPRLNIDVATFYNSYTNLLSAEPQSSFVQQSPAPAHVVLPLLESNRRGGTTYGSELFAEWRPRPLLKLSASYRFLQMNVHQDPGSLDSYSDEPNGASPKHQYYVRSSIDLPKHFEADVTERYVDRLKGLAIPSYQSLDMRIGFRPESRLEFSISGNNLLGNRHLEFRPDFITTAPTEIKRTLEIALTSRF